MSGAQQDEIAGVTEAAVSLVLENEHLRVTIYPALGAKIGSILALPGGHELLQQPLLPYGPRIHTMAFEDGDASGYDECVPTVSGCEIETPRGRLTVPDHGDFWRLPFEAIEADAAHVAMTATGFSLPLRLQKTVTLDGDRFILDYQLTNVGTAAVEYLWSAHPGFAVEAGDRIVLPASVESVLVQGSGGDRLGAQGTRHPWPFATDSRGDATDLSLVGSAKDGFADKLFALAPSEGWCALDRRGIGRRIEMRFDPKQAPYLGIWYSYNGWPPGQAAKQYCVALEPCTAPTDSLETAIGEELGRALAPGASDAWRVEVRVLDTFADEAHRQSLAVANSPFAKEDQDFIDALSEGIWDEE